MTQVKIRAVGRDYFWSAGRKWTSEGRLVTIVEDDPTPKEFKRAAVDRWGNYIVEESQFPEGSPIPMIPARTTRAFWRGDRMFVRDGDKEVEVLMEFDFPAKDPDFQARVVRLRAEHDRRDEITESDYATVRADHRFLAIESPVTPVFEPARPKPAQPQQQQQPQKR